MVYPCFFRKWRYMVAAILNLKKCTREIFGASSEFVWGEVHVSFLKKSAFCNFIPGSTLMLLHYKEIASDYQLKEVTLGQVTNSPYLGVSISENLEWGDHISKIASKANSTLGFLRRNLKGCPSKLKEIAYFSMVRSLLEYSCPVWDPYRQGDIDKLNKIQRAAARFVTNNYQRKSSVTALIQDLGWTDLQTRRKNFRLTSLYKILNGLIAVPVSDLLTPADERTRGGHKKSFKHIRANTTLGQNSFLYKTIPD